jgi:DNA-binding IclR family transcriptional regulator
MAAMNVSCHATRATISRMRDEFLPHLLATAAEVSDRASALRVG